MVEIKRPGLTVLAEGGQDPAANIVFIHGLLGDPRRTWEKKVPPDKIAQQANEYPPKKNRMFAFRHREPHNHDKQPESPATLATEVNEDASSGSKTIFWPEELLPRDIPNAKIFTYGYNADVIGGLLKGPDMNNVSQHATNLMVDLTFELKNKKPIIFVAHSLGGIVVKDALRRSKTSHVSAQNVIYESTAAIVFLGTPHRGSGLAGLGETVTKAATLILHESNIKLVRSIDYNSEILSNIHEEFRKMITAKDIQLHSFRESRGLSSVKGLGKVVDDFSSIIEDPKEVVESIDANHMTMTKFSSSEDQGYHKIQRALSGFVDQILKRSTAPMRTESGTTLLNALGEANVRSHLDLVANNHEGTLEWILLHPSYNQWKSGTPHKYPMLWMPGPLGSGKSTALKFLIDRLGCSIASCMVVFFFCDGRDPSKRTEVGLLRSIVRQMLQKDEGLLDELSRKDRRGDLSLAENLWDLMEQSCLALAHSSRPTYVLIDGVDELQDTDRAAFLERFKRLIRDIGCPEGTRCSNVRFLLTSRPWTIVKEHLGSFVTLEFERECVQLDIKIMLTDVVQSFARLENFPDAVASRIIDTILDKAQGMFLWASLAWNHFKDIDSAWSERTVRAQLRELDLLPSGIIPLYEHLLRRLQPGEFARNVFKWLTLAKWPLRSSELNIGLELLHKPRDNKGLELLHKPRDNKGLELAFHISRSIQHLCGPFIRLEESEDTVNLVHHSARTFFLKSYPQVMLPAHVMIMDACLTYLCFSDIPWGPVDYVHIVPSHEDYAKYGLLRYAMSHWYSHYKDAEAQKNLAHTMTMQSSDAVANKKQAERCLAFAGLPHFDHNTPHEGGRTALHIAASWSWHQAMEALLSIEGVDASRLDNDGWSPLHVACHWSLSITARQLIDRGGWKMAFHTNATGWHALQLLVKQDLESLACMILERFERLPESVNHLDPEGNCLLHSMIRKGWEKASNMMIQMPGLELNLLDRWGKSPLHYAVSTQDTAICHKLIAGGTKLSHVDLNHATALMYALDGGMVETIDLLISNGAQCEGMDIEGRSTLHYAVSRDWVNVVERLVKTGANINNPDNSGILPVHLAAFHGNPKLVRWFMAQPNVQINTQSYNGDSVLFWAAKGRQEKTLELLLRSANIEKSLKDQFDRNILHVTIPWARPGIIQQILALNVVELDVKDHTGITCLHRAAWEASNETLKLVLEEYLSQGLNIDQVDAKGRAALHYAAENSTYAAERLLCGKADQNIRDADGLLPLDIAILWHNIEVLKVLDLSLANPSMLVNHIRRSPPPFAANLLHHPDTFFFKARGGDPPHIHMVEASDRDVLRLHEIFARGAEKEVFGRLDWSFDTSVMLQEVPTQRSCPLGPRVLASWNAIADGEDAFVYLQIWRQRDTSQCGQQIWTHTPGTDYQGERGAPLLRAVMSSIKHLIELAWRKDLIRYGEEAPIVKRRETT